MLTAGTGLLVAMLLVPGTVAGQEPTDAPDVSATVRDLIGVDAAAIEKAQASDCPELREAAKANAWSLLTLVMPEALEPEFWQDWGGRTDPDHPDHEALESILLAHAALDAVVAVEKGCFPTHLKAP